MSIITDFSVPFDPNSETLDFSAWTDFDIKRLSKVINLTRNKVLYNQPSPSNIATSEGTKFISFSSNILTLKGPLDDCDGGDILIFDYSPASGGGSSVDVVSSVLPTGASTSGKQDTGNTSLASIDTKMTTSFQDQFITGQSAQTAAVNNILSAAAGSAAIDANGFRSAMVQIVSTATGGTYIFEGSNDNVNFVTIPVYNQLILNGTPIVSAITSSASQIGYIFAVNFRYIRLRIVSTITGGSIQAFSKFMQTPFSPSVIQVAQSSSNNLATSTSVSNGQAVHSSASVGSPVRIGGRVNTTLDTTLVQGDTSDMFITSAGQTVQKPYGSAENDWQYAAAANGIVNTTTAVTIKTAGAASIRNYIAGIKIMAEALGAATELVIRDGAAGTVIFRTKIPVGGLPLTDIQFPTPLRGSPATLLEVATLTASVTGAVYVNAQGYQSL